MLALWCTQSRLRCISTLMGCLVTSDRCLSPRSGVPFSHAGVSSPLYGVPDLTVVYRDLGPVSRGLAAACGDLTAVHIGLSVVQPHPTRCTFTHRDLCSLVCVVRLPCCGSFSLRHDVRSSHGNAWCPRSSVFSPHPNFCRPHPAVCSPHPRAFAF